MPDDKLDIFFDENHDITSDGADLKFADITDIVKQRLTIRLQFLLGEWFLDNNAGIPYTQTIFKKGTSLTDVYDIIRAAILNTSGVEIIETLDLIPDADGRSLRVIFEVIDDEGNSTGLITVQV